MKFFYYYLAAISVFAVFLTVYDKRAARKGKWRISESALLCTAALGGSVAMFLTMLLIRHKTKHIKFMLGIPIIMVFQAVLLLWMNSKIPLF